MQEGIARVMAGGGVPSLAHPIRVARRRIARQARRRTGSVGRRNARDGVARASKCFTATTGPRTWNVICDLARRLELAVTGGSDFHGANKPRIELGRGFEGNLNIPRSVLDDLRAM